MPSSKILALAQAIAAAEGFGVDGAIPTKAHNPGDLVMPGWTGPTLGAEKISVFSDDETGWAALYRQLELIRSRKSHIYVPSMTILDMAKRWTPATPEIWAQNVCDWLSGHGPSITVQTPLSELLG